VPADPAPQPNALQQPTRAESARIGLLYHFCRMQFPALSVSATAFKAHLERAAQIYTLKSPMPITWPIFLEGLYALDWTVCCGCLEGLDRAWEKLFAARTGRSDCLLVDALRARACRLYPRDEEKQETSVAEFWSHLIVSDTGTLPVLFRYDGQRPLAPWLIRVFQNWHLSKLRQHTSVGSLPDDDIALPIPTTTNEETRWHEVFITAARDWLGKLDERERVLLGLRWRYKMSQRDVATLLKVHEGTISRQTDKLRDRAREVIGAKLVTAGWTGEDLDGFILTEMGGVLLDDPRLTAESLTRLLKSQAIPLPE